MYIGMQSFIPNFLEYTEFKVLVLVAAHVDAHHESSNSNIFKGSDTWELQTLTTESPKAIIRIAADFSLTSSEELSFCNCFQYRLPFTKISARKPKRF